VLNGLSFSNVKITGTTGMQLYYGANVDLSGLTITGPASDTFGLTNVTTGGVPLMPGDFNRDGQVNSADLAAMIAALTNIKSYEATYNLSDAQLGVIGDLNNDFSFTSADVQMFINLLKNGLGSTDAVPEPSAVILAVLGAAGLWGARRSCRNQQR
jgi:Dockerin type I domain/PEP-CTERM motif